MEPDSPGGDDARLGAIIDALPVAISLIDEHGAYILKRGGLAKYLGDKIPSQDAKQDRWRVLDEDGRELPQSDWPFARALRGAPVDGLLGIVRDENDVVHHFRIHTRVLPDPSGRVRVLSFMQEAGSEQRTLSRIQQSLQNELAEVVSSALGPWRDVQAATPVLIEALMSPRPAAASSATSPLTNREHEVLRLFAWGFSRKDIASRLGIAVKTAEFYQTAGMRKLGARNRVDVVVHAIQSNWMSTLP